MLPSAEHVRVNVHVGTMATPRNCHGNWIGGKGV